MIEKKAVVQGKRNEYRLAFYSDDLRYRYALWIVWDSSLPAAAFVGLNPSTATELVDDPTVRRCKSFASSWGCGGMVMLNIFAFRSTDPRGLLSVDDPIGEDNTLELFREHLRRTKFRIAAWGAQGRLLGRGERIARELGIRLDCLALNCDGSPGHPLYLAKTRVPYPFNYADRAKQIAIVDELDRYLEQTRGSHGSDQNN